MSDPTATPVAASDAAGTVSVRATDTQVLGFPRREPPPDDAPAAPLPEVGEHVGPYLIQEKLGEGVSCHVFRGWDDIRSAPVALKIVNWANVYDRAAAMRQLRTEALALSRVKHAQVIRFIDFGFDPRWPYLVTEFFEGRPLGELLRAGGALPAGWGLYLISQMVDALGAVWRAGVVHRDLKPDNILVGPNGIAKLIDFGLAKAEVLQAGRAGCGGWVPAAGAGAAWAVGAACGAAVCDQARVGAQSATATKIPATTRMSMFPDFVARTRDPIAAVRTTNFPRHILA